MRHARAAAFTRLRRWRLGQSQEVQRPVERLGQQLTNIVA